jgi:hypothetical protein
LLSRLWTLKPYLAEPNASSLKVSTPIRPHNIVKLIITIVSVLLLTTSLARPGEKQQALPEYTSAEAKKHIGETARVTDKVGCALANRHGGYNLGIGECDAQKPFWVVTHGDISGPKLDVSELKGVVVTVTGKIDNESEVPRIFVKSTSQIVPYRH